MRKALARVRSTALRVAALTVAGLLVVGCASGGGEEMSGETPAPAGAGTVQFVIQNTGFNSEEVAVLIQGGVQESLGTVPAGQTRTFELALEPRNYELSARGLRDDRSIRFQLFGNTTRVTWDMNADRIIQED